MSCLKVRYTKYLVYQEYDTRNIWSIKSTIHEILVYQKYDTRNIWSIKSTIHEIICLSKVRYTRYLVYQKYDTRNIWSIKSTIHEIFGLSKVRYTKYLLYQNKWYERAKLLYWTVCFCRYPEQGIELKNVESSLVNL